MGSSLKLNNSALSPNHGSEMSSVEYVVIHYTAVSLQRTVEIFQDKKTEASSHFVIDIDGTIYEMVPALSAAALVAHHAGKSFLLDPTSGEYLKSFNQFSIGIEIVNANGNLFPYTNEQYQSLLSLLNALKDKFPKLKDPTRIIGHEDLAWWRGKCDPGITFDWGRILPADIATHRTKSCPKSLAEACAKLLNSVNISPGLALNAEQLNSHTKLFERLSLLMETSCAEIAQSDSKLRKLPKEIWEYAFG